MSDWKEIEDHNQECSDHNGWCGFCWRCGEHADWLHFIAEAEERENPQRDDY